MADKDVRLELMKRARRRVIGAIVLAVTAAVVLPMVMDQEPRPVSQDIQIRIPGQEAGTFTSRVLPGVTPTPLPAVEENAAAARPADTPRPAPSAGADNKGQAKPVEAAPEAPPKTEAAPARSDKQAEEAKARAALSDAAPGKFVVQMGVFASRENARKVQARVKAEGYNVFVEPMETAGGVKIRVRAGPFDSREAAEKARDKLQRAGMEGMVASKNL